MERTRAHRSARSSVQSKTIKSTIPAPIASQRHSLFDGSEPPRRAARVSLFRSAVASVERSIASKARGVLALPALAMRLRVVLRVLRAPVPVLLLVLLVTRPERTRSLRLRAQSVCGGASSFASEICRAYPPSQ
jgi:hypothetical protein